MTAKDDKTQAQKNKLKVAQEKAAQVLAKLRHDRARNAIYWIVFIVFIAGVIAVGAVIVTGCANPTPSKAWSVALTSYTAAAKTMTQYCAQPQANQNSCQVAAQATLEVDPVIVATKDKLANGTIQEAELAAATSTLNAVIPLLMRAGGGE